MTELKPCPFCGGEALMIPLYYREYYVKCGKCKVEQGHIYKSKQTATTAWNRRVENEHTNIFHVKKQHDKYSQSF